MELITWVAAQAIAQTVFNKFIESGAGELGKSFASGSSEKIRQKVQQLAEFVWHRLKGKPEVVAALPGVEQNNPQDLQQLKTQVEQVLQDENDDFTKQVKQLTVEIYQEIYSDAKAENIQQIFGGQGLQVNATQEQPIVQIQGNPTLNFGHKST